MPPFVPPQQFVILETEHWWVNHRCDTPYPGYLMVGAKAPNAGSLPDLCPAALAEVGGLLARCTAALTRCFGAQRVYCGRYGHQPGHTVHFHVIPVYDWTVDLFAEDERCAGLRAFYGDREDGTTPPSHRDFDGADMTLFIWRRFAEPSVEPPDAPGPSVGQVVSVLRKTFQRLGTAHGSDRTASPGPDTHPQVGLI